MATEYVNQDGSYDKKVPDGGDGQSKAKFGNHNGKTTDNLPKPSQKSGSTSDPGFKR